VGCVNSVRVGEPVNLQAKPSLRTPQPTGIAAKPGYAPEPRMKLMLTDESLLPDLLSFLRKEGCVAYYEGSGIEAVRPHSFGEQEASELRAIAKRWWAEHPEAQVEMSE
jgi:hypothetical protein